MNVIEASGLGKRYGSLQGNLVSTSASRSDYEFCRQRHLKTLVCLIPLARIEVQAVNPVNWTFKFWACLRTRGFYNAHVALMGTLEAVGNPLSSPLIWVLLGLVEVKGFGAWPGSVPKSGRPARNAQRMTLVPLGRRSRSLPRNRTLLTLEIPKQQSEKKGSQEHEDHDV